MESWKAEYIQSGLPEIFKCYNNNSLSKNIALKILDGKNLKMPKLFKYIRNDTPVESIRKIINGNIRLFHSSKLNDIFDGFVLLDKKSYCDHIVNSTKAQYPNITIGDKESTWLEDCYNKYCLKMKRYFCYGSYSLSEVSPIKYNPLWSHYGSNGKGICFEYDLQSLDTQLADNIHPVQYVENLPKITRNDILKGEFELQKYQALFTKHKDWSYEKEWRYSNFKVLFKDEAEAESFKKAFNKPDIKKDNDYFIEYTDIDRGFKPTKIYIIQDYCSINMKEFNNIDISELKFSDLQP